MARRSICVYEGKYIGVDKICTLRNGMRVYIEGEVEALRELGHQKKLFCHCGCGANVTLVAGRDMKRAPHFRLKHGAYNDKCTALNESDNSIWSKLMLKLWLQEKLQSGNIESKVSLDRISSSDRKFEFTFYDFSNQVGVCYWNKSDNITSSKVNTIEGCEEIGKVLYISDIENAGTDGQYQEFMNKIQCVQGYNLYLNLNTERMQNVPYEKVTLDVRVFVKSYIGFWRELNVISDMLSNYSFSSDMELLHNGELVKDTVWREVEAFKTKEAERQEKERIRQEKLQKEQARLAKEKQLRFERAPKERVETREKWQQKMENDYYYKRDHTETGELISDLDFATYGKPVINQKGDRYKQCKICKRKSIESYFVKEYQEMESNFGICFDCKKHGHTDSWKMGNQSMMCPLCDGELEEVYTGLGYRLRCKNYPVCKYMENL